MDKSRKLLIKLLAITMLSLYVVACRDGADDLPYNLNETKTEQTFSYENQFKAIWTAMDCNYPLWDYESRFGIDWDDLYDKYLPKFQELDKKEEVPYESFKELYDSLFLPLHDHHFYAQIWNKSLQSILNPKIIFPAVYRNKINLETRRKDVDDPRTYLDYYLTKAIKEMECEVFFDSNYNTYSIEEDSFIFEHKELRVIYALFNDNIPYLKLESFKLLDYDRCVKIWERWYNKIKELHENKSLKGIIIDLRHNEGGNSDYQDYFFGSLIESSFYVGDFRYKKGNGRLDYAYSQWEFPINSIHVSIKKEPIAVLSNCWSGSLSEMTCIIAKNIKNAKVIGMRTWGAMGGFAVDGNENCEYWGRVKFEDLCFSLLIPSSSFLPDDGEILEGVGVTPDIEAELDVDEYERTGRDTQLERALEYIRTGN